MDLRHDTGRPGAQHRADCFLQAHAFRVEAPEVLMIEDQPNTGLLVNPQDVGWSVAKVVVLQNQAGLGRFREPVENPNPSLAAAAPIAVHASDVDTNHSLRSKLNGIK